MFGVAGLDPAAANAPLATEYNAVYDYIRHCRYFFCLNESHMLA